MKREISQSNKQALMEQRVEIYLLLQTLKGNWVNSTRKNNSVLQHPEYLLAEMTNCGLLESMQLHFISIKEGDFNSDISEKRKLEYLKLLESAKQQASKTKFYFSTHEGEKILLFFTLYFNLLDALRRHYISQQTNLRQKTQRQLTQTTNLELKTYCQKMIEEIDNRETHIIQLIGELNDIVAEIDSQNLIKNMEDCMILK